MNRILLIAVSLLLCSCLGDDDGFLDGDLITAITGLDSIYTTSGAYVNMETNLEESGAGTAEIIAGFDRDDLRISLSVREPLDLSVFESVTTFDWDNEVIINYQVYDDFQIKEYIVDNRELFLFSLETFTKNEVIGNFEFTLVNIDDPLDTITFKEGYLYVFD